ncbi:MAG TPA: D-glycero-beta-D-manno-heptose-7-phosphate kinase [Candidatus Omnitrophota bacterium]|nr:D-glycero-beta-D-manno-heptose-7-phosphate kinase [Candidatus Omnitrophota bacterium]HPS19842.1 D-glycero-beta-D-manno-heptose-7-phosphate kinase [Candidatus Omnitrophota bacterium]
MDKYKFSTFEKYVNKFSKRKILVVGDLLLDQYIWGEVSRISPEAPVPVVWVKREDYMPGGASNVANNLAKLGADVTLVGVVGNDERGELLKSKLEERGIDISGVFTDDTRPTSLKTRVIAHHQQVVRIDRESVDTVNHSLSAKIAEFITNRVKETDGVIVEDYDKGVITPVLLQEIVPAARKHCRIISVDPKESHFPYYKNVTVITPNNHEASRAVGFELKTEEDIIRAGQKIINKLKTDHMLITLGERGMMLCEKNGVSHRIPTIAQEVFDVSGAGDTVISVYTLAYSSGATPIISAHIANCAAGIVVGKVGAAVVSQDELLERLKLEIGRAKR